MPRPDLLPRALAHYAAACQAITRLRRDLVTVSTVGGARAAAAHADAWRAWAKSAKNRELEVDAAEIRFRAERRVGELIAAQRDRIGLAKGGRPKKTGSDVDPVSMATLTEADIDKHLADRARKLAAIPAPAFEQIVDEWRVRVLEEHERVTVHLLREGDRQLKRRPVQAPAPIAGQYRVIYADPPWAYDNHGVINDADGYGRADRHYATLSIADLCALPVQPHARDDAVLFLWVTSPLLAECWPVFEAWGFTYKASIIWDKVAHNFGHYVSVRHELLLIGTRGSCLPDRPTPMPDSVQTIPRSPVHSQKPPEFRALIEQLYDGPRLELFARAPADGWATWGDQVAEASA